MPASTVDEGMTGDHEVNTNGEPDALKGARPVRKGIERKGLGNSTSLSVYLTPDDWMSEIATESATLSMVQPIE